MRAGTFSVIWERNSRAQPQYISLNRQPVIIIKAQAGTTTMDMQKALAINPSRFNYALNYVNTNRAAIFYATACSWTCDEVTPLWKKSYVFDHGIITFYVQQNVGHKKVLNSIGNRWKIWINTARRIGNRWLKMLANKGAMIISERLSMMSNESFSFHKIVYDRCLFNLTLILQMWQYILPVICTSKMKSVRSY